METPEATPLSPLERLSMERFKGKTFITERLTTVGVSRITLLKNNPNRLFWMAVNESANDVRLSTDPNVTATSGWILAASGGIITMFWEEDGEGVGYEVYAISPIAGNTVRIREVSVL